MGVHSPVCVEWRTPVLPNTAAERRSLSEADQAPLVGQGVNGCEVFSFAELCSLDISRRLSRVKS